MPQAPWTEEQLRASLVRRLWEGVDVRGPSECWEWQGAKQLTRGEPSYGVIRTGGARSGRLVRTHRLALQLATDDPGEGLQACHRCDNPPCCNPAHLFWGTNSDNQQDASQKGRNHATHCLRGHPKTPENTYERMTPEGYVQRICRVCRYEKQGVTAPRPGTMTETHCRNGHELAAVGTYVSALANGRTRVSCKACVQESRRRNQTS